jgi:acetyl-CoA carboxylase carboxyltransferase component
MCGYAYRPRFLFIWPNSKTAVMGPQQLAGVLSIVRRAAAQAAGKPFDEAQDEQMRRAVEEQIEKESLATFTSGQVFDDGIIDPRDSRTVLGIALSAALSAEVAGAERFGVFRM